MRRWELHWCFAPVLIGSCPAVSLALLGLSLVGAVGCHNASPLSPSPIIIPDAITLSVGETQIFKVLNASALSFTVSSDAGDWRDFVGIESVPDADSVEVIALRPTTSGYIYIIANLRDDRAPLVAAIVIQPSVPLDSIG